MTFYEELKTHLKAGVSAIYVESSEWMRFRAKVGDCCKDTNKKLYFWNSLDGLSFEDSKTSKKIAGDKNLENFTEYVKFMGNEANENSVYVLEMADSKVNDPDVAPEFAVMIRTLSKKNSHVIMFSPELNLPKVVEKEFAILDFSLPGRNDIKRLLHMVAKTHKIKSLDDAYPILDSVRGLGTTEIRNAFAKIAVNHRKITADEIPKLVIEKEQIIRKSGYLNFIRTDEKMDSIGGLEELKKWLRLRKNAFGEKARNAKLNTPKGVLLLGIPGTGKSLCAKAVAQEWKMPLLRLDMGSIFSSGVGDSESNMRGAIKVAESLEPCVLWIDEIEKGVSGGNSGELDGGTSARVFGSFLTWMQEKKKEVFIFATANNISRLPPEMLRKGRFDEIFFVDLPGDMARKNIFHIHLENKDQKTTSLSDDLISMTKGFSGSEIEAVVNEALFMSYETGKSPKISTKNLMNAIEKVVPLSTTMGEIEELRKWAKNHCRLANNEDSPKIQQSKYDDNWFTRKSQK